MGVAALHTSACLHCGKLFSNDALFCCLGCESVYEILKKNQLLHYYDLKKQDSQAKASTPIPAIKESFQYLQDEASQSMQFYLQGVHCIGCLWLIEKLPKLLPGVKKAHLNYGKSIVTVWVYPHISFVDVAEKLQSLGYQPHPILEGENKWQQIENKWMLARLGIAAACAGNIMLLAVSVYAGASGSMQNLFHWISFTLSIPVLTFCAWPFYENVWMSIKSKSLSIDIPIVLAILAGAIVSTRSLLLGKGELYFDSLSTLIFLLLGSRYFLKRVLQTQFQSGELTHSLLPRMAKVISNGKTIDKKIDQVKVGDQIFVPSQEFLPVDGKLSCALANISSAFLTGEHRPYSVFEHDTVYAGMKNEGADLTLYTSAVGKNSRMGKILSQVELESRNKSPLLSFADKVAKWFTVVVLAVAAAVFLYFLQDNPEEALRRSLALIIVSCPCVLALAIPLVVSKSLSLAARKGIIIKNAESLERIANAQHIFLDKTGTLTEGQFVVKNWLEIEANTEIKKNVFSLEKQSQHPVAKALLKFLAPDIQGSLPQVTQWKETFGLGVAGWIDGKFWEVKKITADTNNNTVGIFCENKIVASTLLGDTIRHDAGECIENLKKLGLTPHLLSGDHKKNVFTTARELKIEEKNVLPEMSPEQKCAEIKKFSGDSIMVGDGANDAIAFSAAGVGIAVHGSMDLSLKTADIYISKQGIQSITDLIILAKENKKLVLRNFLFSLLYNAVSSTLAVLGFMNPLLAAILMPLSALTIYISTIIGTTQMRSLERIHSA